MLYSISGRQKVLGFYSYLYTVTLAHMWLLNNLSSVLKNVIIVKHNTSAIGKTCSSVVLYCFLKYLRECQFFKEIVIFQKSYPVFCLISNSQNFVNINITLESNVVLECLYPYFNFKWLFDVATKVKILLWHTYCWSTDHGIGRLIWHRLIRRANIHTVATMVIEGKHIYWGWQPIMQTNVVFNGTILSIYTVFLSHNYLFSN